MVKSKKQHNEKKGQKQGGKEHPRKTRKIKASTRHGHTTGVLCLPHWASSIPKLAPGPTAIPYSV